MKILTFAALVVLITAGSGFGQESGDPEAGLALANEICADCHAVEVGEVVSPNLESPSFQSIANNPEMSELALTVYFHTPHPSMPNLIVTGDAARNLVAYILSLKP
jgi:mono/diheme cytochrome c family protein